MNIHGFGGFLVVIGIGLVVGSSLRHGVGFSGELEFWVLCGAILSVSNFLYPPIFTLEGLYVLGCAF